MVSTAIKEDLSEDHLEIATKTFANKYELAIEEVI